ncbi:MAG: glycosyltransferase family 2 protein [Phycisphaeraceae bacterium]|nr:glycosyltransferase family 2 protein [Phycisphaeraceae bacterium]
MPELTVAICTYRRHDMLAITLASLADCEPIDQAWELLVIDNGCQDTIRQLVEGFAGRLPVRYLPEPNLGASHARNRATREAGAPIILFTDDDVTFDPQWLVRMSRSIRERPDCAFWGGRVEPVWPVAQPVWFDDALCPMLGDAIVQYRRGEQPRAWNPENDPPFYTANLALRTSAIAEAGYFDTQVGHRGGKRMGMEDSLMVKAISASGGKGWYAADAVVHHPVPDDRIRRGYMLGFARRQAWLSARIVAQTRPGGRPPRWFFRAAAQRLFQGAAGCAAGTLKPSAPHRFAGLFQLWYGLWQMLWALDRTIRPRQA